MKKEHYIKLQNRLAEFSVSTEIQKNGLKFTKENLTLHFFISDEKYNPTQQQENAVFPIDYLITQSEKIAAIVLSKLKLNKVVYARTCEIKKVDKKSALNFLELYHLMGTTQSATNYGLYFKEELIALASFSKGRKMNRLQDHERSFELIRFCCKSGITVTGGLTRLIKAFCNEKKAGDIMTYVDKQLSDGSSFMRAGFKKHSETEPNYFLIDKKTYERTPTTLGIEFDKQKFYLSPNNGSIKLVFTPNVRL